MSTITLDTLNTIAQPVNTYLPAPANADLLSFAHTVNTLAENGRLDVLVDAFKANEPKAAPAPAKAPVRKPKADTPMRRTKNGGMMSTVPGSITAGQLDKLIALGEEIGDPFTRSEVAIMCDWSMAYASDYRYDILNG
jgi:hypothetical protein